VYYSVDAASHRLWLVQDFLHSPWVRTTVVRKAAMAIGSALARSDRRCARAGPG